MPIHTAVQIQDLHWLMKSYSLWYCTLIKNVPFTSEEREGFCRNFHRSSCNLSNGWRGLWHWAGWGIPPGHCEPSAALPENGRWMPTQQLTWGSFKTAPVRSSAAFSRWIPCWDAVQSYLNCGVLTTKNCACCLLTSRICDAPVLLGKVPVCYFFSGSDRSPYHFLKVYAKK